MRANLRCRSDETEIWSREASEVREDLREIAVVHAEPGCQRSEELIASRGGNPTTGAGVVWTANGQDRECPVSLLTVNCAAHNHVMAAPTVIAALAVAGECPSKVAARERSDALAKIGIIVCG